jgi:hypothetical protein
MTRVPPRLGLGVDAAAPDATVGAAAFGTRVACVWVIGAGGCVAAGAVGLAAVAGVGAAGAWEEHAAIPNATITSIEVSCRLSTSEVLPRAAGRSAIQNLKSPYGDITAWQQP